MLLLGRSGATLLGLSHRFFDFRFNMSVLFNNQPLTQSVVRFSRADFSQRPGGVASDQRLFVIQRMNQSGNDLGGTRKGDILLFQA